MNVVFGESRGGEGDFCRKLHAKSNTESTKTKRRMRAVRTTYLQLNVVVVLMSYALEERGYGSCALVQHDSYLIRPVAAATTMEGARDI
jgi:hypothetical protein